MFSKLINLTNIAPVIKTAFRRFPLPFVCALIGTLLTIIIIYDPGLVKIGAGIRSMLKLSIFTMAFSVVALTSLKLYAESAGWLTAKQLIGSVMVVGIIALYLFGIVADESTPTYLFLGLAVLLSLLFAPYITKTSNASSVWYFNYQTGTAIFFAGLSAMVLGVGASLIFASLDYLFHTAVQENIYGVIWTVSWGLLFPAYVLSNIATEFNFEDEICEFPKGISFITNYILVPLMFVYMVILYAYFVKIIISWELPRGNLGWMITTFGTIGIATKLLAFPIRNRGTRLLALFDKYYYYALVVPVILLAIAIAERVNAYGITEQRYTVMMIGVWFSIVTVFTVIQKDRFHIKYVPIILAVLALLSSIGPWGAVAVSTYSQVSRLETLLVKHHMLVDGQAIASKSSVPFDDLKSISSIADYLTSNKYRFAHIKPWFAGLVNASSTIKFDNDKLSSGNDITNLLKIKYINRWESAGKNDFFNYTTKYNLNDGFIDVKGYDYVARDTLYHYNDKETSSSIQLRHHNQTLKISFRLNNGILTIESEAGDKIDFNLFDRVKLINDKKLSDDQLNDSDLLLFTGSSVNRRFNIRIIMTGIHGEFIPGDNVKINSIHYILMARMSD
jgi:hypothetical protein